MKSTPRLARIHPSKWTMQAQKIKKSKTAKTQTQKRTQKKKIIIQTKMTMITTMTSHKSTKKLPTGAKNGNSKKANSQPQSKNANSKKHKE